MNKKLTTSQPLSFGEYQAAAATTDQTGDDPHDSMLVSVLGITGEAGDLATLFKKKLRDGDSFTVYPEQCAEELGDILWYLSNVSSKLGLKLEDVARKSLVKTEARWKKSGGAKGGNVALRDRNCLLEEQFPRQFTIEFREEKSKGKSRVRLYKDGIQCGDSLTDNAHYEDGYRFHDVFHLAYVAVLCWSPVSRKILNCKRRQNSTIDEVEDGGRAAVIEESVSALAFQYAEKHNMLDSVGRVDAELLSLIVALTGGLEVNDASKADWEEAILQGFKVFRLLTRHGGGLVDVDLQKRTLNFRKQ